MVAGILSLAWHEFIPARSLMVENLSLYAADGTLTLEASGEITRQAQRISSQFSLLDSRNKAHRIDLLISPEAGIDFQLVSPNKNPLSVNLKVLSGVSGLAGSASLDLAQVGQLIGQTDNLTGFAGGRCRLFFSAGLRGNEFHSISDGQAAWTFRHAGASYAGRLGRQHRAKRQ